MLRRHPPQPVAEPEQPAPADPDEWIAYMRWLSGATAPEQSAPLDRRQARTQALREGRFTVQDL